MFRISSGCSGFHVQDYPCSATIVNDFFLFRYQTVVDESIAVVIKKRQVKSQVRGLTEHDLFFREVNKSD